ncbi:MAG: DUF2520 domain-containing protein [Thermodesulfobacteriota bacterium]|nr:DUF2520 domain-containing protein [Thermodesulfobacteriota bacterium]
MKQRIALIGPGRVGCAVSKHLHEAGYQLTAIIGRNRERAIEACTYIGCSTALGSDKLADSAAAQILLLAVPDDQIQNLALQIQATTEFANPITMIHFSGLHPAEIMRHDSSSTSLLSLHPLLPFASRQRAFLDLRQCPCALESDTPQTLALGQELVNAIGGHSFTLESEKKPLYHTAACVASNYLVTLLASARDLLVNCGIEPGQAIPLLMPLVQASLDNVKNLNPEQGLTGPIVRGDIGTVTEHIQALENAAPELLQLYLQMGKLTVLISNKSGRLDAEKGHAIDHLFSAKTKELTAIHDTTCLSEKNN